MKICHFCTGFAISFQGGITNYVRALADAQVDKGNEVWVVSAEPGQTYGYAVKPYQSKKIRPFALRALSDKAGLREIESFLQERQFDLIHVHMVLDVDWDLYKVLKPYHYVVSLHDYFYLCPRIVMMKPNGGVCAQYNEKQCEKCVTWFDTIRGCNKVAGLIRKLGWKNFRFPAIGQTMTAKRFEKNKMLLENAQALLPVSTRVQQIYENSGICGNYKMLHIGNITADRYSPVFAENRDKDKIDVVMLGSLIHIKGRDLFVKLARSLDNEKFRVNFYGRSADYAQVIQEAGIVDHGPYKQDELPAILANADIGLVLSIWEDNGPQVVMEMLNNHVPVVGTRMGGIPDFVKDGENGFLFDPYGEDDFDRLVDRLNGLTREDIIGMKRNIQPTMTTTGHAEAMDEVYRQIIEE